MMLAVRRMYAHEPNRLVWFADKTYYIISKNRNEKIKPIKLMYKIK